MSDDLSPSEAAVWRQKYNEQRKKSRILTVATAVLAVVAVGLGVWGFTQSSSDSTQQAGFPGAPGQMGGYGPPAGGQMPDFSSQLFNDDGSVNTEALQQMVDRNPSGGGIDQFLQFAQQSGQLTDKQVEALKAAAEKLQSS